MSFLASSKASQACEVSGVDQRQLFFGETDIFERLTRPDPQNAGRFHHDTLGATDPAPVGKGSELGCVGSEFAELRTDLVFFDVAVLKGADKNAVADVDADATAESDFDDGNAVSARRQFDGRSAFDRDFVKLTIRPPETGLRRVLSRRLIAPVEKKADIDLVVDAHFFARLIKRSEQ